jgi:hypothetical protein
MQILSINLRAMSQDESFQFHTAISAIYKEAQYLETASMEGLYASSIVKFDDALKQVRHSDKTIYIVKLDLKRDHDYLGIAKTVDAYQWHYDPEFVAAAHTLDILLKSYGNPVSIPYNAETSVIYNLSQEFISPKYAPLMAKLGLTEWAVELKRANDEFDALFNDRGDEQSVLIAKYAIDSRREVEESYRRLMTRTEGELLKPNCELKAYVDRINERIAYYKNTIAIRKGRNATKKKKEDGTDNNKPGEGPIELKGKK